MVKNKLARNAIRQASTVLPLRVRDGIRLESEYIADILTFRNGKVKDEDRKRIADVIHDANIDSGMTLDIELLALKKAQKLLGTNKLDLMNNDDLNTYLYENPGKELDADDIVKLLSY